MFSLCVCMYIQMGGGWWWQACQSLLQIHINHADATVIHFYKCIIDILLTQAATQKFSTRVGTIIVKKVQKQA